MKFLATAPAAAAWAKVGGFATGNHKLSTAVYPDAIDSIDPLDKSHTRGIALPRTEFDDSGVTAVPFGGSLRDVVEQLFHDVFLP